MNFKRLFVGSLFFITQFLAQWTLAAGTGEIKKPTTPKYPKIIEVLGTVHNLKSANKEKITPKFLIVDGLSLQIEPHSTVKVQLDEKRILTAYGPAEFEIPGLSWESREFSEIRLHTGAVRFEVAGQPFEFMLKSSLFEIAPPKGETIFIFDPQRALADAMVLKGELEFRALNAEESAKLTQGQKVTFMGQLEEGEISYDLLLQGRKIPKGRLLAIQPISKQDLSSYSLEMEKRRRAARDKKEAAAQKKEQKLRGQAICSKPFGQLNDCHWKKQGESCYRTRCVADGKWKDSQKVDSSACGKVSKVQKCDY